MEGVSTQLRRIPPDMGAGAALVAAVAVKASAGILLPIIVLGSRRRLRVLTGAVIGGLVLGAATLYAFGPHLPRPETSPMIARELTEFFATFMAKRAVLAFTL